MTEYTEDFKNSVREYFKSHSGSETMRKFDISRASLYNWTDPEKAKHNRKLFNEHYARKVQKKKKQEKKNTLRLLKNEPHQFNENILLKPHLHYEYPMSECVEEIEKSKEFTGSLEAGFWNKTILTFQPHFFEAEKKIWFENKNNIRQWLVDNRKKYIGKDEYQLTEKEILRSFKITGKHIGFSHFNPKWFIYFIEKYNIKSVYDPTGGWGHRLIGSKNIKYIYNDLDPRTYQGCKCISDTFKLKNNIFYNENSALFTPPEEYEAVFTCPPYHNTEIYQNKEFSSLEDYRNWWENTLQSAIKPSVKTIGYVISNELLELTKKEVEKKGFQITEENVVGKKTSHLQHNTNQSACEVLVIATRN